jgi:hypothetical protein
MIGCKHVSTPKMDSKNIYIQIEDGKSLGDISQYQKLIETIIYLTVIWSKLTFIVSKISQLMHSPKSSRLEAINKILKYLKGTSEKGISMKNNYYNKICGCTDVD